MRRRTLVVVAVFLLASASAPTVRSSTDPVRQAAEAFAAASGARDAAALVSYFAPDVVVISPQAPTAVSGVAENRARWDRFFQVPSAVHTMTTDSVVVSKSEDLAYTRGKWTAGVDTPSGRSEGHGEYVAVWRPVSGQWKIVLLMAHPLK